MNYVLMLIFSLGLTAHAQDACTSDASNSDAITKEFTSIVGGQLLETQRYLCKGQAVTQLSACGGKYDISFKVKEREKRLQVVIDGMSDTQLEATAKAMGGGATMLPALKSILASGLTFDAKVCRKDGAMLVQLDGTGVAKSKQIKYAFKRGENGGARAERVKEADAGAAR